MIANAAQAKTTSTDELRARLTIIELALGHRWDRTDAAEARRIRRELDRRGWK